MPGLLSKTYVDLPDGRRVRLTRPQSDLVEFNACQAMLKQLYELGLNGKKDEFLAYRILYLMHGRNRTGPCFFFFFLSFFFFFWHMRVLPTSPTLAQI